MTTITQANPCGMNPKYSEILEREFRKAASVSPNVLVKVIFAVDEEKESTEEIFVIVLSKSNIANLYNCQSGSDDDDFYFTDTETGSVVNFDIPPDWIDLYNSVGESP